MFIGPVNFSELSHLRIRDHCWGIGHKISNVNITAVINQGDSRPIPFALDVELCETRRNLLKLI